MKPRHFAVIIATLAAARAPAQDVRWFPDQEMPKTLVRVESESRSRAEQMLLQSVAGLAARSVNRGQHSELVWIASRNADIERWLTNLLRRADAPAVIEEAAPWSLVDRSRDRGLIKGFILYRLDDSAGETNAHRPGLDQSVNVATSLAGLLEAVIVDESLESEAKAHGLKMLLDARDKSPAWCWETYREQFHRRMVCFQDPRKPHVRDLAIAHNVFTTYGDESPTPEVLRTLDPLSPVLGWNGGDEFVTTEASTVQGHFQTATDWCWNLPVLMAGSRTVKPARTAAFDPRTINWDDRRSGVSFICSDGDNVQWLEGNYFGNPHYWGSPARGRIPFGWSCCFAHLSQLAPMINDFGIQGRTPADRFIEWGGGYYYPDSFAKERPERWKLLAEHARRTWGLMQTSNTRLIGFNVADVQSDDARRAYETFASQTDGLLAILVFQYAPYEGGAGRTFWVKDRRGREVPVISARYAIWEHSGDRPNAGTPAKVARVIRETVEQTSTKDQPRYDWAIAHVWSWFRPAPGSDENAEDMPQADGAQNGGTRGYVPVTWCAERLPESIRVLDPEELAWRIRMQHNADETRSAIEAFEP